MVIRYMMYITIKSNIMVIIEHKINVYTILVVKDIYVMEYSIMVLMYRDNTLKIIFKIYIFLLIN